MIAIIDYDAGNLKSVEKAFGALDQECVITGDGRKILAADRVVLPGVGAFGAAMEQLRQRGLDQVIREVVWQKKPFLGICLGMQLLFDQSFEYGEHPGLGLIPGDVAELREDLVDKTLKIPHMGWNRLETTKEDPLFRYFQNGEYVYYVHSFYARNCRESTLGVSQYGNLAVTGVVRRGNVWGTQFHPEKSGDAGLRLLRAFAEL